MPIRGVGARLSLAVLAVVAGALALVYVIVVPSLEKRLVDAKLKQLERAAPALAEGVPDQPFFYDEFLETASGSANARVVIYAPVTPASPVLLTVGDSNDVTSTDVLNDPVAIRATLTGRRARGTVTRAGERFAEVAVPLQDGRLGLLLSSSLADSLGAVNLVQRRLVAAGVLALAIALLLGYGGAWAFARRIRRLERAAERIAGGRFDEPVVDRGGDELGELAASFERMRERLARLDDARREFIANASHELRTPLFSLGGFLELLADEDLDDATRRDFLVTMREQVARLTKLATDLLDLSRLDAGRLHMRREPVELGELAAALVGEFRAVARATGHPLEAELDQGVSALGDAERVLQIGRVLIENALVHTGSGTTVRVRVTADSGRAVLAVEDDGPGIRADHAGQVFERFYRADGARASGSGLGLAIARELAELMDGTVELESGDGRTAFTLTLPRAAGRPDDRPQPAPRSLVGA